MARLKIRHESVYSYSAPVRFGRWRLLFRPVDNHANRLIGATLETPPAKIEWANDAFGNSVCFLTPTMESNELRVVNNLVVDRYPAPLVKAPVDDPCSATPIVYALSDRAVLAPFIGPTTDDDDKPYRDWLRTQLPQPGEPAVAYLTRLTKAIQAEFEYAVRWEEGTQSPAQTVGRMGGTCRDFAWLMVESVRRLGFAARFATGYLYSPGTTVRGAGSTHAWCEVFLPELGWIEFDPTNGLVESESLIRVAATQTWREADPMNGPVFGDATCDVTVGVDVDLLAP